MMRYRFSRKSRRGRGYKAMMRRRIPKPQSISKYIVPQHDYNLTAHVTNHMYQIDLYNISRGGARNQRENDWAYLTGLRLRWAIFNNVAPDTQAQTNDDIPGATAYHLNMCIVAPRGRDDITANTKGGDAAEFFRALGGTNQTAKSFQATLQTVANGGEADNFRRSAPINKQQYAVLWHYRKLIPSAKGNGDYNTGYANGSPKLDRYIKLNLKLTYDGDNGASVNQKLYLLYWFTINSKGANTIDNPSNIQLGAPEINRLTTLYFKDT